MKQWITTREAAMELGVSSSTFKRFCDLHRIPILRTPGGHRRIDRCHVDVVSQLLRTKLRTDATTEISVENFVSLLKSADSSGLRDLLLALADTPQRMVSVLEDYLAPALWKLGDMCVAGETELAMVRICISTASTVLDSIAMWMPRVNSNRLYVGATFPQNSDTIANKIVSIGLLSIGIKPVNLGPGIAPLEIASAAMICGAESIWLSHTHIDDPLTLSQNHTLLRSGLPNGFPVIIGGGGLSPSLRRQMPECKYYESVDSMLKGESLAPLASQ